MSVAVTTADDRPLPAGARALGTRVRPTIRLSMGYRDMENRGRPVKTEGFRVKGDNARAITKFGEVYGAEPKAVDIMLRPELNDALDIRYRAFGGGQNKDGGGMLKAVGNTNYALLDYMGGPDTLTVFGQNGVEEVDITGLDDPLAQQLGLELAMTFRFGLPKVLSYGAVASISTRGKESIDTLWSKCREWYALATFLGAPVPVVTGTPLLVLKPSTMMTPRFEGRGDDRRQTGWSKAPVFVLDLVLTETLDEMVQRVNRQRAQQLNQGGPTAMLYGGQPQAAPDVRQLERQAAQQPPAEMPEPDDFDDAEPVDGEVFEDPPVTAGGNDGQAAGEAATVDQQAADDDPPPLDEGASSAASGEPPVEDDPGPAFPFPPALVDAALAAVVPSGSKQGRTLAQMAQARGGHQWFAWARENRDGWPEEFAAQLDIAFMATWGVEA